MSSPTPISHPFGLAPHSASPRRRHPVQQPPNLLTTSLENHARNATLGAAGAHLTPLTSSSTTLSSPFSAHPHSAQTPLSAGGAMNTATPPSIRHTPSFSHPYNPQQWGPLNSASPQSGQQSHHPSRPVALAPRLVGPDEPVVSPPPPYSPRREGEPEPSNLSAQNVVSPSDTTSPETDASRYATPLTSANTLSPDFLPSSRQPNVRPHQSASATTSPNPGASASFPPPPSTQSSTSRLRSSSKDHAGRLLSSLTSRNRSHTSSPIHGVDALSVNTSQVLEQVQQSNSSSPSNRAPASRRAASTGDISLERGGTPQGLDASPSWELGRPLPPPPPGPPPRAGRTQSLNRPAASPSSNLPRVLPYNDRRPPGQGTSLGPVPPTPADWQDDPATPARLPQEPQGFRTPLHIDTGSIIRRYQNDRPYTASASGPSHTRRDSSTGGLARTPAVRTRSVMGLRERRSESKHGKDRVNDVSADAHGQTSDGEGAELRPSNLDLVKTKKPGLQRQSTIRRSPGSGTIAPRNSGGASSSRSAPLDDPLASHPPAFGEGARSTSPTPPASAQDGEPPSSVVHPHVNPARRFAQKLSLTVGFGADQRPLSHILHTPNPDDALQVPLTPSSQAKARPASDLIGPESPRAFAERAIERHRRFAEREASASTDSERLDLFIGFMVAESKIRREQYAQAFTVEDLDVDELAKELFQPIPIQESSTALEKERTDIRDSRPPSTNSSILADQSSQDDNSIASRTQGSPSSATSANSVQPPLTGGLKDFVPCLSPIASMSAVTGQDDEMNSRGRPPSRWWDTPSQSGSAAGDGFSVLGRTKRESKYMGVPKEARNSGAFLNQASGAASYSPHWQGRSPGQAPLNDHGNAYPPEKVGWHEEASTTMPPPPPQPRTPLSAPLFSPNNNGLDISRLVTLPPPFPRHHPAVNNSHPDLADVRNVVRLLHEADEPSAIKSDYTDKIEAKRKRAESWCEHQRSLHRQDVQYRMENEQMTQEQFDQLETEIEEKLRQSDKDLLQVDFDMFQDLVVQTLHALFAKRISIATATIENLTNALFTAAQSHSPNLPQEEGDEQPELLEKLTQLKWLFEARESLHRRTYDLLSERNDKYKAIVILPYKQAQNHAKISDAEEFFRKDSEERLRTFEGAVSERAQSFLSVVEHNVGRGVEMQLDAFWQIAPGIKEVLHKIPGNLHDFVIRIPAEEYDENPSYHQHPLQYLSSLLNHAEKATYQFIESQTNLLCFLHEIRSCAVNARCAAEAHDLSGYNAEARLADEERRLTADLKDRVSDVEGQWADALGEELRCVRERVRERLLEDDGWDDESEEI